MFKTGTFSRLSNTTVKTLYHYEKIDILQPVYIDENSGYRYYSADQLITIQQIKSLQNIGLELRDIKKILEDEESDLLEFYLEIRSKEMEKELQELKEKYNNILMMKGNRIMNKYNVSVKTIPSRKVMSIRRVVASYNDESKMWEDLYNAMIRDKVKLTTPTFGMSLYYGDEYNESNHEIEVQSNIIGDYNDSADVNYYITEELLIASTIFKGDFNQVSDVVIALAKWIETNEYSIVGPMVNISHVSPAEEKNPENWVTESGYIIKKKLEEED